LGGGGGREQSGRRCLSSVVVLHVASVAAQDTRHVRLLLLHVMRRLSPQRRVAENAAADVGRLLGLNQAEATHADHWVRSRQRSTQTQARHIY
jgi:hypothetical protein